MSTPNPDAITVGVDVIEYDSVAIAAGINLVTAGGGYARLVVVDDTSTGTRLDVVTSGGTRTLTVIPGDRIECQVREIGSSSTAGRIKVYW